VSVNPRTNTVYVADYASGTLTVIDGRDCNAANTSGCDRAAGKVRVGRHPFRLTADPASDTVYVTNFGANTLSVVNGAACNGRITSGCRRHPASVRVGGGPEAVAVDDRNHLAFVTNSLTDDVSVFDTSTCNGSETSGCGQASASIKVGRLPNGIAIDDRTETVYVADNDSARPGTLAMFRAAMP
jgi:DNA-binding beta-propeller fold protein YncE